MQRLISPLSLASPMAWALLCVLTACTGKLGENPLAWEESPGPDGPVEVEPGPTTHWSFQPLPNSVALPAAVGAADEPNAAHGASLNEIDAFVAAELAAQELSFAPPAAPGKLLRRVTLDLTGLPPTIEALDVFESDPSPEAYEAVVDRLLASPRYAEHMAAGWLDLARYSDTDGFQYDNERPAWPWRDWVLKALNDNMPFDEFTVQQLAGDLLPDATAHTQLATSFNRNHAIQGENGLLKDEFRDRYVADRVTTLGRTWLGLTTGCAKCHDHKLDPLSAEDYYKLYDCFNHLNEFDNGPTSGFSPAVEIASPLATPLQQALDERINTLRDLGAADAETQALEQEKAASSAGQMVRIMYDMADKRDTKLLALGRYDLPVGNTLRCAAPAVLPPFPEGAPANRLGLAQWLVMPDHPLTSRVTVNRVWHHHFGRGLVDSMDDFGTLTAAPQYLGLLNWLAREFVNGAWDMKALHKLIVTSRTYQQSSSSPESALTRDPDNEHLARGPRHRVSAEVIRDLPLAVSGLLVHRMGGPPAYPYQPPDLWEEMAWEYNKLSYPIKVGDSLYRRSVYTYWKRTLPPPFMSLFDAPDREESQAVREPGITAQQALALLNGPQFVEAARHLADKVLLQTAGDVDQAVALGFRMVTSRVPTPQELSILRALYDNQHAEFSVNPTPLALVQATGNSVTSTTTASAGAMTQVMRAIFNLSETITKD